METQLDVRVREVLAVAAPYISAIRGGEAFLAALATFAKGRDPLACAHAIASGLYWHSVQYYVGQADPLYALASVLGYRPSPFASGPEEGSDAEEVYDLAAEFLRVSR